MPTVTRAGSHLKEALKLQLKSFAEPERNRRVTHLLESQQRSAVSLHDCLVCHRANRIVAVQLLVRQPDGTIYVWPPETSPGLPPDDDEAFRKSLYQEARQIVDAPDIWIGQTLLETSKQDQSTQLHENGFPRLTDLVFMNYSVNQHAARTNEGSDEPQPDDWKSEPFTDSNSADFAKLIEQTYQNTQDCPELNGTRDGFESLESHRQTGEYDPNRWRLFRHEGEPAGLLLLNAHPPEPVWEIVYFGIAPQFRGKGFGARVLHAGMTFAKNAGTLEVVLAVDVRNEPALRLYREMGFTTFDRRIVHARLKRRHPPTR